MLDPTDNDSSDSVAAVDNLNSLVALRAWVSRSIMTTYTIASYYITVQNWGYS